MPLYTIRPTDRIRQHPGLSPESIESLMDDEITYAFPEWCDPEENKLDGSDLETLIKLLYLAELNDSFEGELADDMRKISVESFDEYWRVTRLPYPAGVGNSLAVLDPQRLDELNRACPPNLRGLAAALIDGYQRSLDD